MLVDSFTLGLHRLPVGPAEGVRRRRGAARPSPPGCAA